MAIIAVKDELKLNKFEYTRPIQSRNLVGRLGYALMPSGSYTGDDKALTPMTKLQLLTYGYKLVEDDVSSSEE